MSDLHDEELLLSSARFSLDLMKREISEIQSSYVRKIESIELLVNVLDSKLLRRLKEIDDEIMGRTDEA